MCIWNVQLVFLPDSIQTNILVDGLQAYATLALIKKSSYLLGNQVNFLEKVSANELNAGSHVKGVRMCKRRQRTGNVPAA